MSAVVTSGYGRAVEAWTAAGWHGVLPLPARRKTPPPPGYTGSSGAWPTEETIAGWIATGAPNACLRLPDGVLGVDVDAYGSHPGADTLLSMEARCSRLPATWTITSRTDGVSGIRLFRVPVGISWRGEAGPGIDIIQHRHRYCVLPPSIHPEGRAYRLIGPDGELDEHPPTVNDLPALPTAWVDALREPISEPHREPIREPHREPIREPHRERIDGGPLDRFKHRATVDEVRAMLDRLGAHGWRAFGDLWHGTRPGKTGGTSVVVGLGRSGSPNNVAHVHTNNWSGLPAGTYTPSDLLVILHNGDARRAAAEVLEAEGSRPNGTGKERGERTAYETETDPPADDRPDREPMNVGLDPDLLRTFLVDPEWWTSSPALSIVHCRARMAMISSTGLLVAVLAELAARLDRARLPDTGRGRGSPNLLAGLVGPPGAGKSTTTRIARDCLPLQVGPGSVRFDVDPQSGEALLEAYYGKDPKTGERLRSRTGVLAVIDEGERLTKVGDRAGSTLLPTLRSLWSGGAVSTTTATSERLRELPGGTYSFGLLSCWQWSTAVPMLRDDLTGTAQRMLWASTVDPDLQLPNDDELQELDPIGIGPLRIPIDEACLARQHDPTGTALPLNAPTVILNEIRDESLRRGRGIVFDSDSPRSEHRTYLRLKVAGLLAVLHSRTLISFEDWCLARALLEASDRLSSFLAGRAIEEERQAEQARTERRVRSELAVDDGRNRRAFEACLRAVVRRAMRSDQPLPARTLWQSTASEHRSKVVRDEVLAAAVRSRYLAETSSPDGSPVYSPGPRPLPSS